MGGEGPHLRRSPRNSRKVYVTLAGLATGSGKVYHSSKRYYSGKLEMNRPTHSTTRKSRYTESASPAAELEPSSMELGRGSPGPKVYLTENDPSLETDTAKSGTGAGNSPREKSASGPAIDAGSGDKGHMIQSSHNQPSYSTPSRASSYSHEMVEPEHHKTAEPIEGTNRYYEYTLGPGEPRPSSMLLGSSSAAGEADSV
ncbi:hypothetical protein PLESTF_000678100 [Pleodorina starrii]|nr:hypothetical protein PLESTF_000678100 [Pleodorina starrii]